MAKTHGSPTSPRQTGSKFVRLGYLMPVEPTPTSGATSPSRTRVETDLFVKRLAGQYRAACGERLVVTSLTRPASLQPRNASDRSVHPTGMAVDLRVPPTSSCRR
jgi:hypothetical protein